MVEGGSLENCFTRVPGNEGSNPSSSATNYQGPGNGALSFSGGLRDSNPAKGKQPSGLFSEEGEARRTKIRSADFVESLILRQ